MAQRLRYEAVPGFFIQSEASSESDPHPPAFGLKAHTSATYWADFQSRIKHLKNSGPPATRYVVCWLARHGQGWHNVAVDKYGADEWERHLSKINGKGGITWGPDAKLTPLGETQAKEVNELWKAELARPDDPIPTVSPPHPPILPRETTKLNRLYALAYQVLLFTTRSGSSHHGHDVIPKDDSTGELVNKPRNLREQLAPYTSDHRSSKTQIQSTYPAFEIEDGFSEEDELWGENFSESSNQFNSRIRATLDSIFGNLLESTDTYVSITAHSGVAATILRIIGHRNYPLPAGGVVPVVIKIT